MKKHTLALAVASAVSAASFSAPAVAQNVTLFGFIDASVVSINKVPTSQNTGTAGFVGNNITTNVANPPSAYASTVPNDRMTGMVDGAISSARWGMRGTEDLGGGMSALFHLEGDANIQGYTHSAGLFRRGAYAGLSSKEMGELTFGLRLNPVIATHGALMPVGGNSVSAVSAGGLGFADFYTKNAITYVSPRISGIQIQGQHGFSNDSYSSQGGSMSAGSVNWTGGDLTINAAYQNRRGTVLNSQAMSGANNGASANLVADKTTSLIGASYKLSPTLTGAIATFRNTIDNPTSRANIYDFSMIQYGLGWQASPAWLLGTTLTTAEGTNMMNLQARYALSKRTTTYVQAVNTDNGNKVAFSPVSVSSNTWAGTAATGSQIGGCGAGACAIANTRQTSVAFGIMHSF
jgi:predicted porin